MSDIPAEHARGRFRRLIRGEVALWGVAAGLLFSMTPNLPAQSLFGPASVALGAFVIWRIVRLVNLVHR